MKKLWERIKLLFNKKECSCICHLPIYSKAWCVHCKGDNIIGRKLVQRKKQFYKDTYLQ